MSNYLESLDERSLRRVMADMLKRLAAVEQRTIRGVGALDEVSDDLGAHSTGKLLAITASDPTEVEANGAFFDADGVEFSDGQRYHVGGVHNGQLMFGLRAEDGAGVFAGGQGVIDRDGMHLTGIRYAMEHLASDPDGNNPRRGAVEMFYPDGGTIPAYRIVFGDGSEATELVVNGNFGTGDTAGWTATLTGASTFTVFYLAWSGYWGYLTRAAGQSGSVASASGMSVTAGKRYRARLRAKGGAPDSVTLTGRVDWYDGAAVLIKSSTVLGAKNFNPGGYAIVTEMQVDMTVEAPAGAVTAKYYFTVSAGGEIYFTAASLQLAAFAHQIVFDDNGLSVLRWGAGSQGGVDQDNNVATAYQRQTMVLRAFMPILLTGLLWDVRNTGDYELWLVYTPGSDTNMRKIWSGNVGAAGEITMTLALPEVLLPGIHYLTLFRPAGAVTWWDKNVARYVEGEGMIPIWEKPAWMMDGVFYGTSNFARIPGAKILYKTGAWT